MSGIVSFIIKGQDALSAPLAKMSNNSAIAKGALGKLTESNKQLKAMMGESGKSVAQLSERISQLKQYRDILPASSERQIRAVNSELNKLNKEINRLSTINGSALKVWAKEAFEELPRIAKNPIVLATAAIVSGINQGMKDARGRLDFGLLVGDKKAGTQIYDQLRKQNPLTGGAATESGKQLLNAGFGSGKVADTVSRLGAVSMGDAGKMNVLTAAFAQVKREGKLTESTLQQLNDAGFKPLTIYAEKHNLKMSDMIDRLEKGKIGIKTLTEALNVATDKGGQFGNVLDALEKDPSTMWDTLTEKVTTVAGKFGDLFMPTVTGALHYATIGMDLFGQAIDWVSGSVKNAIGFYKEHEGVILAVGAAIGGAVLAYKAYQAWQVLSYMWTMRSVIADTAMIAVKGALTLVTGGLAAAVGALNAAFMLSPIGWIVGGFGLIIGAVVLAWNKFEGFRKALYGIWEAVKTIFHNVYKFFMDNSPLGMLLKKVFDIDTGKYESVGEAWGKGAAKGAASWEESQKKKEEDPLAATNKMFGGSEMPKLDFKRELPDNKTQAGLDAVSGGGAKIYNVTIHKMIESLVQHVSGGKEAADGAVGDLEVALARLFQSLR